MTDNTIKDSRYQNLIQLLKGYGIWDSSDPLRALVDTLYEETDFFTAPASTKWHAAYTGGLCDHCVGVMQTLVELTQKGVCDAWGRSISPFAVGLLHDATKFGAYVMKTKTDPETGTEEVEFEWDPTHKEFSPIHGEDSLLKVQEQFWLTEEEKACIRWHMGAYEGKQGWPGYDAAIRKFPNVLWTHTADMYASKVLEERNAD